MTPKTHGMLGALGAAFQGHRKHFAVGAAAYILIALMAIGIGVVYLRPPGRQTVAFDISDAAAVKPGIEVRAAGVHVGKVETVDLHNDSVRVKLSIDHAVYVGDQSTVELRMLTAAGGYYVNLISAGPEPLGAKVIPTAQARPPYQLTELLADSAEKVQQIDPAQLGAGLDQLASGLEHNPGALTTITASVRTVHR